jgi:hypothetical protein
MTPGALRKRRFRQRQRLGLGVIPVEADVRALAAAMILAGYLHPRDAERFHAVALAYSNFTADLVRGNASLWDARSRR